MLDVIAPGVIGIAREESDGIWISVIVAESPGRGDVAKFLDALPLDRSIYVPTVIDQKLVQMLERRGFIPRARHSAELQDVVVVWTRKTRQKEKQDAKATEVLR